MKIRFNQVVSSGRKDGSLGELPCSVQDSLTPPHTHSSLPDPLPARLTCGPHGGLGHLEGAAPRAEAIPTVAAAPL